MRGPYLLVVVEANTKSATRSEIAFDGSQTDA